MKARRNAWLYLFGHHDDARDELFFLVMGGAMRLLRNLFVLVLMTLLVSACVTYSPSERFIGMSREQVIAAMGRPYPLPDELDQAQRLDFPRGPSGKHTYRVQFDAEGKIGRAHV